MPPEASTNLPVWRSVAPVKAPFSWPNRMDSTRLSGMAPQLTATNGLARRSPEPWIARAISSLPTPDCPAISTGMAEVAALPAVRSTACMRVLRVTMSRNVRVPARLRLMRASSPCSALATRALRSETCRRSGLTGLTTKSVAPARITETTVSMPPWAVCTMTGSAIPASRRRASTPRPSRSGMTRSSTTTSTVGPSRSGENGDAASPPSATSVS